MLQKFHKYHGAGNDFVLIDITENNAIKLTQKDIATICHRRFGVGADGLITLGPSDNSDFKMTYYNSDGLEGTMCGNGGRCAVQFAYDRGMAGKKTTFDAVDGLHKGVITDDEEVNLMMQNIGEIKNTPFGMFADTGSPHLVIEAENLQKLDVKTEGEKLRHDDYFYPDGVNVNYYQIIDNVIHIRTFERGVEAETWACGTGSVATAVIAHHKKQFDSNSIKVQALGGQLTISFEFNGRYENLWLKGPAQKVFEGYDFIK
ncbi:Diaminopimelate epimerase [Salinivirga cyanobacteriivorans]|uniref:Diaminopimelate epimerase n=1 Tax=Salinivirga cyanobacteriivorans TaxID=1307839 RepID=A0A0S2I4W5_9BACT|nr:diaminopimelate epimerase [Salinivirga cyanobacteriivorans]ALO17391.1 Diaminopimelate epimerase [Salinivirga cyanobacteriivorans]